MAGLDLSSLNEQQMEAVIGIEPASLVLYAGAGSGKTRVLTYRIGYLISESGTPAHSILAITFTNKAAAVMKDRLKEMLGEGHDVWISTFHSFCATVLRRFADRIGFNTQFSIYDESDTDRVIKKALRSLSLDGSKVAEHIKKHIGDAKNEGLSPDEYFRNIEGMVDDAEEIRDVYKEYERTLLLSNAMDFDDLLTKTKLLFETCDDVVRHYQKRFKYIHVDEFQDTNKVQLDLVKMLSKEYCNVFVVGDDDQCIYSWRGARIENLTEFDKSFEKEGRTCKIYKLEQNYRSTQLILTAANNLIKNNTKEERYRKRLFTKRGDGAKVEYFTGYNDYEEVNYVISTIRNLKRQGYKNSDFVILVRTNSLTRLFEQSLTGARMEYRLLGGFRFFDRKEIQDVLAYMRAIANPKDGEAAERIIGFPKRGIGDTTIERLSQYARENNTHVLDVLFNKAGEAVPPSALARLNNFSDMLKDITAKKDLPIYDFTCYLVERVGFKEYYLGTEKEEDETRWENTSQFLDYIKEWQKQNPSGTLDSFLETARLKPETDRELYDRDDITISTIHAVKGLEFKVVFIVACEEEIFPSGMSKRVGEREAIEEERRVMYVAITRAMERLFITNAKQRSRFGRVQHYMPSRFIAESQGKVPGEEGEAYAIYKDRKENLWRNTVPVYAQSVGAKPYSGISAGATTPYSPSNAQAKPYVPPTPYTSPTPYSTPAPPPPVVSMAQKIHNADTAPFVAGKRVSHPDHGNGTIIIVSGTGNDKIATVAFERVGLKKLQVAFAPIKII